MLIDATTKYKQALNLLPEFTECKIRLGIVTAKENQNQAISYLKEIKGKQAAYIRGFAHAQLGNWQQANKEWKFIHNKDKVSVEVQRHVLKNLIERDRLSQIKEIEVAVDNNNIEIAKIFSLELIDKFDSEPTIQQNLENHIQPLLDRQIWETQNWQQIAAKTEQIWLEQQDIKSLHNWAIASYYLSQTDSSKLGYFIIAWSTALANIDSNPTIQNVPWLGSNSVDIKDVSAKLKQLLENAIDVVKDSNINEYLKLRDNYGREMLTLSLIKQNNCGVRIKQQLSILPGCYQRYRSRFHDISFPAEVWGALYTDWGTAVAACHAGDIARAITIKPSKNPSSKSDRFAYSFVSYHEGCRYLQNQEWHTAIKPLQQGLDELIEIRDIDRNNTTTLNLIETVEIQLELEKIDRAMKREFKEAITIAKRSRHEKVRFRVAEVCIDILLKGAEEGSLNFDGMYQLAQWASELCPREPAFMPIYNKLGIY